MGVGGRGLYRGAAVVGWMECEGAVIAFPMTLLRRGLGILHSRPHPALLSDQTPEAASTTEPVRDSSTAFAAEEERPGGDCLQMVFWKDVRFFDISSAFEEAVCFGRVGCRYLRYFRGREGQVGDG